MDPWRTAIAVSDEDPAPDRDRRTQTALIGRLTIQPAEGKHEQAARLQARIERDRKPGVEANAADVLAAKNAWSARSTRWPSMRTRICERGL